MVGNEIPQTATSITLYRISGERLIGCETVEFLHGKLGVELVLRRAAISGRVEVGGKLDNHFADLLDANESIVETVALDRNSYWALKNHWMRCKVQHD